MRHLKDAHEPLGDNNEKEIGKALEDMYGGLLVGPLCLNPLNVLSSQ